ncbi:hypothetical protein [Allonocardiopsis opalescens]|uniref:Uncharacterized protein n=1 Tax=Allonocardiopsis opalescens TaxID=1144618 RepID=A0A2T0Q2C0_9ACTN|nr:hypothetical protein [Allonocardiopsis opalescens]PRX97943.1 hypothetical protein CLV72_105296 [Allonocardiopsis opalescens]
MEHIELIAGPMDGAIMETRRLSERHLAEGIAFKHPRCGIPGGHSVYTPDPERPGVWLWRGDTA